MKIDGGCHCGHITYRAEIDPEKVLVCHCTDCQTLSGSAYRSVVITVEDGFELLSGTLKTYVKTAESGNKREQAFCPECGTPFYSADVGEGPKFYGIRLGTARQRDQLRPKKQVWCRSARDWVMELGGIRRLETQTES